MPATNRCLTKYCRGKRKQRRLYCEKCAKRRWREKNPLRDAYCNLRNSANRRHIPFHITFQYYVRFAAKYDYLNHRGKLAWSYTVNRKEHTEGYIIGNLEMITNSANVAQGNRDRALNHVWNKLQGCKIRSQPKAQSTDNPY